jgi:hypothetical protein
MPPGDPLLPFHFEFDSTNRILWAAFSDVVTDEDITFFYRIVPQYFAALDPLAGIMDLSAVTSFEVSVQTVRNLGWSEPAMPHPERPRFIVAESSHIFGMARMFEFEGDSTRPNLYVVRSAREAWVILGIREPQFTPVPPLDHASSNPNFAS